MTRTERQYSDSLLLRLLERLETGSWCQKQQQQIEHGSPGAFATRAERKAALEKARAEVAEEEKRDSAIAKTTPWRRAPQRETPVVNRG